MTTYRWSDNEPAPPPFPSREELNRARRESIQHAEQRIMAQNGLWGKVRSLARFYEVKYHHETGWEPIPHAQPVLSDNSTRRWAIYAALATPEFRATDEDLEDGRTASAPHEEKRQNWVLRSIEKACQLDIPDPPRGITEQNWLIDLGVAAMSGTIPRDIAASLWEKIEPLLTIREMTRILDLAKDRKAAEAFRSGVDKAYRKAVVSEVQTSVGGIASLEADEEPDLGGGE